MHFIHTASQRIKWKAVVFHLPCCKLHCHVQSPAVHINGASNDGSCETSNTPTRILAICVKGYCTCCYYHTVQALCMRLAAVVSCNHQCQRGVSLYVNAFNANLLSAITTFNLTRSSGDTSTLISSAESERTPGVSHWRHEPETSWGIPIKCCNINQEVIWIH